MKTAPPTIEDLCAEYGSKLRTLVYGRMREASEEDREDAVQAIIARAWRRLPSYDPSKAQFHTWLYTVAHNVLSDLWRRTTYGAARTPKPVPESIDELRETGALRHGRWSHRWARAIRYEDRDFREAEDAIDLEQKLSRLSPEERFILTKHYLDGFSDQQIGRKLDKPTGTVRSIRQRAAARLREIALVA